MLVLFVWYPTPFAQHSFPTRRSSDLREKQDPSLEFDFVCRAGICGSCGMMINGRPTLACRMLTKDLGEEISLAPRSEEHTSELQSRRDLVCRLLLEKKKGTQIQALHF